MSRAKRFENYPDKLYTSSAKELAEWLDYWNAQMSHAGGPGHQAALKEKLLVEKILATKQGEILHDRQLKKNQSEATSK